MRSPFAFDVTEPFDRINAWGENLKPWSWDIVDGLPILERDSDGGIGTDIMPGPTEVDPAHGLEWGAKLFWPLVIGYVLLKSGAVKKGW